VSSRWSSTPESDGPPDFRLGMIQKQLKSVRKVLLVLSGKGGVGKSLVSATFASILADSGMQVGLMDADIYGPSSALLFDVDSLPEEGKSGLVPPVSHGVKVMSVDLFASGRPLPLTGYGASQVLLELLALTKWGDLDCLVVDMPPSTGDIMLTITGLRDNGIEALVVTTGDRLSTAVAHRTMELLQSARVPMIGVLENMRRGPTAATGAKRLARGFGVPFLGSLPYDAAVSRAVDAGAIGRLMSTHFARELRDRTVSVVRGIRAG
jgi:ATP-binding protein involved in chromosome partitioning